MRSRIISFAALTLGTALTAVPAFAQHAPTYSNTGPTGAPLSPGGISAAASAYMGPGYSGPSSPGKPITFSTGGPDGAPLSPGGISAAASAYRGPGYSGPSGTPSRPTPVTYSNTGPGGAPLSPGGISAAADAYGGPGYMGR
jgi:hypothetical protein